MTKLEEAARALANSDGYVSWDHVPSEEKNLYRIQVHAVVGAIREATPQMRLAGITEYSRPDPGPEHASTLIFNAIWRAMVDALLTEEQK